MSRIAQRITESIKYIGYQGMVDLLHPTVFCVVLSFIHAIISIAG